MQILIAILIILSLLAFIVYKIDNRFDKKEIIIYFVIVLVSAITYNIYEKNQSEKLPNSFKEKYFAKNNIEILKLSSELLNNKDISSTRNFIYKFTYIINKDGKEYLCTANEIKIKKIEDQFIFENFSNMKEECKSQ